MASIAQTASIAQPSDRRRVAGATLLALAVCLVLTGAWVFQDFANLSIGRLPDTDDMARLAQVRDWLGGQAFHDLSQHRLGLGAGASMHWSRIADAGPALLLLLMTPIMGVQAAELAMLVTYPAILFFLYLMLVARIGDRLIGAAGQPVAVVIAALAFPTASLFMPGRIDHHGLQIVLMLLLVDAMIARPSLRMGLRAGATAGISLGVGLEAAPEIIAAMAASFVLWVMRGQDEDRRAAGFALGLGAITAGLLLSARPAVWPQGWCDGFTPASVQGTLVAASAWGALALVGRRLGGPRARIAAGVAIGVVGLAALAQTSSVCLSGPYARLDPLLARLWMGNLPEAGSLVGLPLGTAIGHGGMVVAGFVACLYQMVIAPEERMRWLPFAIFLALGTAAAVLQVRATYIVAVFAALPLVALIVRMRQRGAGFGLLAAWLLAAGVTYSGAGAIMGRALAATPPNSASPDCPSGESFRQVAALPPGRILAPIDAGAYLIGMTPHQVFAAPYHRNNGGNLAMYLFFLAPPERAQAIAGRIGANYVMLCPSSFAEIDLAREAPGAIAAGLRAGRAPDWLERLPAAGGLWVYRVR